MPYPYDTPEQPVDPPPTPRGGWHAPDCGCEWCEEAWDERRRDEDDRPPLRLVPPS